MDQLLLLVLYIVILLMMTIVIVTFRISPDGDSHYQNLKITIISKDL